MHPCEAIEGVGVLWVRGDGTAHRLVRGVARAGLVLFRELLLHATQVPPEGRRVWRSGRCLPIRTARRREIRYELERPAEIVPVHGTTGVDGRRAPRERHGARRGRRAEGTFGAFR